MSDNGKTGVLMIKTPEKQEDMVSHGMVTVQPRLNLDRVNNDCKYIVCCQDNADDDAALFTDNAAFLIGIIRDTRRLPNGSSVIYLSDFAAIYRENMWKKPQGAQVQYFNAPSDCGMYAGRVQFKPVSNGKSPAAKIIESAATEIAPPKETVNPALKELVKEAVKPAMVVTLPKASFPKFDDWRAVIAGAFGLEAKELETAHIVFKLAGGKITIDV